MSSISYHSSALAARLGIAYAFGHGSPFYSLLALTVAVVQDRHMLEHHLAMVLYEINSYKMMISALASVFCAVVGIIFKPGATKEQQYLVPPTSARDDPWTGPGKPLLFPCITTHTRLIPKKHSFVYSYLVVGVPVGWTGVCGGIISVAAAGSEEERKRHKKGWFHIDADDYLERGGGYLGLRGKLDAHLVSQGADPERYPYAYFVTAPRFLGYHFNPISFWYLYNANKTLAAMVLEVNNTFGERRMYYLTPETKPEVTVSGSCNEQEARTFRQTWPKDFHVSPFNSRKGSYQLRANDPLGPQMRGKGPIAATIVLRTSDAQGKIVAGLHSEPGKPVELQSLDPAAMTLWQKAKFLAAWWWVGFGTFPRILTHACILFFKKGLHVWFRPEPLAKTLGRVADATESQFEAFFYLYLRHLVNNVSDDDGPGTTGNKPLAVRYISCGIRGLRSELLLSPSAGAAVAAAAAATGTSIKSHDASVNGEVSPEGIDVIEFRVLTPVFYTRFALYAHDVEALFCELRESCTIDISPPAAAAVFAKRLLSKRTLPPQLQIRDPMSYVSFKLIQKLRRRPAPIPRLKIWPTNKDAFACPLWMGISSPSATNRKP
ncbi:hypothetical protein SPBR_05750 [Sporothrix brasiliensis 5110]|uniref:DUF1365-domain-containing protein n=1 Tax=Sporothrix brasiliensis 5110 TaxID=1398154 RepID=A0A0C2JBC6_9PEZI|nr:uncharacterized protein SPBR_05750 [Sporothrix brasiliensis 5110]KIH94162.1 hypothetical protein SPBR_05750 [Sporothrix brasiliensis 5110]